MKAFAVNTLFLALLSSAAVAGDKINQSREVQANSKVLLETERGHIEVIGWDKPEFKVEGELDDKAKGYELDVRGRKVIFEVKMPDSKRGMWGNTSWSNDKGTPKKLVFYVPHNAEVHLENTDGSINVHDVFGGTRVETVNGGIKLHHLADDVRAETVNGGIEASQIDGDIKLHTVNGSVNLRDAQGEAKITAVNGGVDISGDFSELNVENVNGKIQLDLATIQELEVVTVNGSADVNLDLAKEGEIEISSVSADINVNFTGAINAKFDLDSHAGGNVKTNLTELRPKKPKHGPGESLEFRVGDGSGDVEITTVSGDIRINQGRANSVTNAASGAKAESARSSSSDLQ